MTRIEVAYPGFGGAYSIIESYEAEDHDHECEINNWIDTCWSKAGVIVLMDGVPERRFFKDAWQRWTRKDKLPAIER